MTPFWRDTPLSPDEAKLLQLTLEAHASSAYRNNASSAVLCQAAEASGDYTRALAGALATLGGKHAPIEATYSDLKYMMPDAYKRLIESGARIRGWGNSFHRGEPDPLWTQVASQLRVCNEAMAAKLETITDLLRSVGKQLYPNPSAYTAAVAITIEIPLRLATWLFVQGRLLSWSQLFHQTLKGA